MWGILGLIVGSIVFLYYLIKWYSSGNSDYWPKRGVLTIQFSDVGSFWELFVTKTKTFVGLDQGYYDKIVAANPPVRYGGMMEFRRPVLMITDLDLIRQVLVKDFDHFVDRRETNIKNDPVFSEMVVMLEGQKWKDVRSVLSPAFTTGKMKGMFEQFNKCGKGLVECVKTHPQDNDGGHVAIVQEIVGRYTVDVIGATAFGMDTHALQDKDSIFLKMSKRVSNITAWRLIKNLAYMIVPKIANALSLRAFDGDMMDFFTGILRQALKNREQGTEKRNDFLQLLVEVRKGNIKETEKDNGEELEAFEKDAQLKQSSGGNKAALFTDNLTMAQSFVFFIAGFDTVGAVVNFAAYLMAAYPDIQEKIYEEVQTSMEGSDGEIDYDTVTKLEYVDMFISEILRRYPVATRLERKCVIPYKIPDSDVTLEKGQLVAVSVQGIHKDPRYYPDPEKFDPERFTPENKAKRHPYAYLPFGHGPRNCIGMRFALFELKVSIAYLAYYFQIQPTPKTPIPIQIDNKFGLNRPVPELELKFIPRSH